LINRQLATVDSSGLFEPLDEPGPNGNGYILQTRLNVHFNQKLDDVMALIKSKQTVLKNPLRMTVGPG
jgi:hypothetical protein